MEIDLQISGSNIYPTSRFWLNRGCSAKWALIKEGIIGCRDRVSHIRVTENYHPMIQHWWPHGHIIGWEHTFVHEFHHFFDCIVNNKPVDPVGASFVDGYRNAVICDAIVNSSESGRMVDIRY